MGIIVNGQWRWSTNHEKCIECGRVHCRYGGRGLCMKCYDLYRKADPKRKALLSLYVSRYQRSHAFSYGTQRAYYHRNKDKINRLRGFLRLYNSGVRGIKYRLSDGRLVDTPFRNVDSKDFMIQDLELWAEYCLRNNFG